MSEQFIIANGLKIQGEFPCTLEQLLLRQNLLPRSVVVEHNAQAVAPSEFSARIVAAGDQLEIVRIVAGG
jgi:thiamine biosynthesis protein ThiS